MRTAGPARAVHEVPIPALAAGDRDQLYARLGWWCDDVVSEQSQENVQAKATQTMIDAQTIVDDVFRNVLSVDGATVDLVFADLVLDGHSNLQPTHIAYNVLQVSQGQEYSKRIRQGQPL